MKKVKKICLTLLLSALTVLSMLAFGGCKNVVKYEKYAHAEMYSVGSATLRGEQVNKLELDWVAGSIEIEPSETGDVQVLEESPPTEDSERMHYYLDGNVLVVKYCASGFEGTIQDAQKGLRVVLPAGTVLDIDSANAVITSVGTLETPKLSLESADGNFTAERIVCDEADIETATCKVTIGELIADKLSIETASGGFSVTKLSVKALEADSASGTLYFGVEVPLNAEVNTASAEVTFALLDGVGATVRFDTASGELKSDKPYVKEEMRYVFAGTGEGCLLEVKTLSGKLIIE